MSRNALILSALGLVVLLAVFWFFGYSPKKDEIADVQQQTQDTVQQQQTTRAQIQALEQVRAQIPEVEAALAAAESVIPRSAALPATLRQLQLAADSSGVELGSVAPGRPQPADAQPGAAAVVPPDLAVIALNVEVVGGYFQIVDFLRRVEDPTLIARGIVWNTVDISLETDEDLVALFPSETVVRAQLTGDMFARLDPAPAEGDGTPAPAPAPSDGASESPSDAPSEDGVVSLGPLKGVAA